MSKVNIIQEIKELSLPDGEYIISGSGALSVRGIREHNDIDILISQKLWDDLLENNNWSINDKYDTTIVHPGGYFEAKTALEWMDNKPTLEDLLPRADYFENIAFMSLQDLKESKIELGREKDLKDIPMIDEYIKKEK
jgi:hypothetical protein